MLSLKQNPDPNEEFIRYRGDLIIFSLKISAQKIGDAFLRTNIGRAKIQRKEIIDCVEKGKPRLDADWHDIKMIQTGDREFSLTLPLLETGVFAAKAFFHEAGEEKIAWPEGDNVKIKVEPADSVAANSIYTAFVRQFTSPPLKGDLGGCKKSPSLKGDLGGCKYPGTFRNLIKELDFIIGTLKFKNIQLLPVHPVPTSFAKMGTFGSPFAVLDLKNVNPAYAVFDKSATPMQQFEELVDEIHLRDANLFLDIPINHTGWASWLQIHHPEWYVKNPDGSFKSPGAWGVVWEDLSELDYKHKDLWEHMAGVFLFWCRRGVNGFRCDAGYMIPQPVWEYIVAKVREEFPDTIFMLEGLGGKIPVTENLLSKADLDWAYSELFQNYDRSQIESYLPDCIARSEKKGLQIHFAETHDNSRLAAKSKCYAKMRTAIAALFSQNGGFGITAGVEWFAADKIDVHDLNSLNWGAEDNQIDFIKKLNEILMDHPSFFAGAKLRMIQHGNHNGIVLLRQTDNEDEAVLVVANLDDKSESFISWCSEDFSREVLYDLISDKNICTETKNNLTGIQTNPGEVFCLVRRISKCGTSVISDQKFKAKALEVIAAQSNKKVERKSNPLRPLPGECLGEAGNHQKLVWAPNKLLNQAKTSNILRENPLDFISKVVNLPVPLCVTKWKYPQDLKRKVVVPASHFLLLQSEFPFNVKVYDEDNIIKCESSLPGKLNFILLSPEIFSDSKEYILRFTFYQQKKARHYESRILAISPDEKLELKSHYSKREVLEKNAYALLTNGRGGMAQVRGEWGKLKSKYDSFLAANLHQNCPVDRHVLFTRCRAWIVCSDYSCEINIDNLISFEKLSNNCAKWSFCLPVGHGKTIDLDISLEMVEGDNTSIIKFCRLNIPRPYGHSPGIRGVSDLQRGTIPAENSPLIFIPPSAGKGDKGGFFPVKIIVRPDIENRSFHATTKAYTGNEKEFSEAVESEEKGFIFSPPGKPEFIMSASNGKFVYEPEWQYMIHLTEEAERGLDDHTDLFSPGYFSFGLCDGESVKLLARGIETIETIETIENHQIIKSFNHKIINSIKQFLVKRDDSLTVIAGYPWFLDWGRDTLIALRGIISGGFFPEAKEILKQFAKFEQNGTLPNMIRGNDQSDRDTSDAPLWFSVACSDFIKSTGETSFIDENCGEKNVREVLQSIIENYIQGTPNGIKMDAESGLIFSPSHFTWMDTNFPAGTPRQGYPIEIQALWFAALNLFSQISGKNKYKSLANQVSNSISELFTKSQNGCLSDCLHADFGVPASKADPDDAIRSNQLFAITLGAVKEKELCEKIIAATEQLLIPGAIRSLADLPATYPLPVFRDDKLLNDPSNPYYGKYSGDEDSCRKPAYHNGTAWTWTFPSYAEALLMTYGDTASATARSILLGGREIIKSGCILQIPEIIDGDFPHVLKGCGAQAWGVTELCRLLKIVNLI